MGKGRGRGHGMGRGRGGGKGRGGDKGKASFLKELIIQLTHQTLTEHWMNLWIWTSLELVHLVAQPTSQVDPVDQ